MIYARIHLRTSGDTANADIGGWEHLPETWATCGLHLEKRRAVLVNGRWYTVTTCGKCGRELSRVQHPNATTGVANKPLALTGSPEAEARYAAIRAYLMQHGPSTSRTLAGALGINPRTMNYHLSRMPGLVKTTGLHNGANHRPEIWWGIE